MKKTILTVSSFLIGMVLIMPSCDDSNGRSLGDIYISIATVIPEGENTYSFLLDNGTRLWPAAGNIRFPSTPDQRVFLNYTILWESLETTYNYDIKVNDIWNILTKEAIGLNAENADSIGNDPVKIEDIWVGGDYLNISFIFKYGGEKPHMVNLIENTLSDETPSDMVELEFRHNAYQGTGTRLVEGFVCFNLKPFRVDDADFVNLSIKVKEWEKQTTYDVVYRYNQPVGETHAEMPIPVVSSAEYY